MKRETYAKIFKLFPSVPQMARELGEIPDTVRKWVRDDKIPPHAWEALMLAAAKRGMLIDPYMLMRLYARRVRPGAPKKKS